MIRAVLNAAPDSDSALGSSGRSTSSDTNDCRTGVSTALTVPQRPAKRYTCQSWIAPLSTRTPMSDASTSHAELTMVSSSRLSNRSASLPAYNVNSSIGANWRAVTTPRADGELCDTCSTSQSCAVICIQPKIREISCPVQNSR
ncbi:MAG: hypothetical protein AUG44_15860 [Actinobacteria bacterium 13_1_20CM_3_71_11]|nr:MAG: hypothetical protein AUG44_15860 [Actinobacteria bacterium 13_1_20CM_3_71_11]